MSVKSFEIRSEADILEMLRGLSDETRPKRMVVYEVARNILEHGDGGRVMVNGVKIVGIQRGGDETEYRGVLRGAIAKRRTGLTMISLAEWSISVRCSLGRIVTILNNAKPQPPQVADGCS